MCAISVRRDKVPGSRRNILVQLRATFAPSAHFQVKSSNQNRSIMKTIIPLFLALLPLAAVVSVWVVVP